MVNYCKPADYYNEMKPPDWYRILNYFICFIYMYI